MFKKSIFFDIFKEYVCSANILYFQAIVRKLSLILAFTQIRV